MVRNCIMKFVLHGRKEVFCNRTVDIIVGTALRVYIGYLLIKPPLAGTCVAYALQLFLKVILAK